MEPQEGAAYRQVSRKEAGLRFLLMQMANAATRQVSDPDRGLEQLSVVLTSLHTLLTALRSFGGATASVAEDPQLPTSADVLRLRPADHGLLSLPTPSPLKFLEAVGYQTTPEGHLALANPGSDDVQSAVEGGLNALLWFERQNQGDDEPDDSSRFTLSSNPLLTGSGPSMLCCPSHGKGGKP